MGLPGPDPRSLLRALARSADPGPQVSARGLDGLIDVESTDPGLFGPGSAAWRLHGDPATIIGGFRSLLLQALHPSVMAGVVQHSSVRDDPFGRLERTSRFIVATVYGTSADAERAIATVRRVHCRVRGTRGDGRAYDATDPELVSFVHLTEVDSFLAANRVYGRRRLSAAEADRYCAEMAEVARRLGGTDIPDTARGTSAWLGARRGDLHLGRDGRSTLRFLFNPPVPLLSRPAHAAVATAAVGLLPFWAQVDLRLPAVPPVDAFVVRPGVSTLLGTFRWAFGATSGSLAVRRTEALAAGP